MSLTPLEEANQRISQLEQDLAREKNGRKAVLERVSCYEEKFQKERAVVENLNELIINLHRTTVEALK